MMNDRKKMKMNKKTTGASIVVYCTAIALCLVFLILGGFHVERIAERSRERVDTAITDCAEYITSMVTIQLTSGHQLLEGLAFCIMRFGAYDDESIDQLMTVVNERNAFIRLGHAGRDGMARMTDLEGNHYSVDIAGAAFFQGALDGRWMMQGCVPDSRRAGEYAVRMAVPVMRDGEAIGALIGVHDAKLYKELVDMRVLSDYGYANIVDKDGRYVIRSRAGEAAGGEASIFEEGTFDAGTHNAVMQNFEDRQPSIYSFTGQDGRTKRAVLMQISHSDWFVQAVADDRYADELSTEGIWGAIVIIASALMVYTLMFLLFARIMRDKQRALALESERSRILATLSDGMLIEYIPARDFAQYTSKVAGQSLERSVERFVQQRHCLAPVHPDQHEAALAFWRRCAKPGSPTLDYMHLCDDGTYRWHRLTARAIVDQKGAVTRVLGKSEDIDKIVREREEARRRATIDPLTGMLNRTAFRERVSALLEAIPEGAGRAMLMLDVDNFKQINDLHGHAAGDQALVGAARSLAQTFPEAAVGRFGGDEFLVYVEQITLQELEQRMKELLNRMRDEGREYGMTCSVGVLYAQCRMPIDDFLKGADAAMYQSKRDGKDGYRIIAV